MKKNLNYLNGILIILLLLSVIFKDEFIFIAPHLDISLSIIIYSLTFLILGFIFYNSNFKEAKFSIKNSVVTVIIFFIFTTLLNSFMGLFIGANFITTVFTPNRLIFDNFVFYYFDFNILLILLVYYLTHLIFISIYDTLSDITNKYLPFIVSLFIAFIIDVMLMIPVILVRDIYYGNVIFLDIIKFLTSHYIALIILSSSLSFIYSAVISKKE